ncbi:hypothetical protein ACTWKB_10360 [Bacillus sp. 4A_MP2]
MKDVDGINLTNREMKTKINRIYKKLNLQPPAYQITDVDAFYFEWQHEVAIKTADQSEFLFNGSTKELLKIQLSKAILQQKKGNISDEDLFEMIGEQSKDVKTETGTREHKQYTFHGSSNLLHVTRDADGIELNWQSDSSLPHTVSNQERDEVYQQVLKKYEPYAIYKKQIKPVRMIDKEGK